ncbi:hypothetical protein [Chroococcus sp. FPU101]|uniref:hypothetical protein n=1 Tax=Chroococcus sp. FPU101 TaxID=1974212 RepID=UPI001A901362|nr:hypothetical protein [Chroococcus sp. FPU101]GFE69016.1 hypothetical protein CFPU101_16260 [Chroococcus sp. FPU101]
MSRKRQSRTLLEDANYTFKALVTDVLEVGMGWFLMLLVTQENPSSFVITLSGVISIMYVVWRNVKRLEK